MDNIIQLDKSRGFTRMDNALMDAMAKVDLPGASYRVLTAVARLTLGYQLETKRLTSDEIGKQTNMRRDVASKAVSHLLTRRILFRVGGSRGEIGISPASEWVFFEGKSARLTETKSSHSAQIVSLRKDASETKTAHCFLYIKKENNLPTEDSNTACVKAAPSKRAKKTASPSTGFGLTHILSDNRHAIPEQLLRDWIELRKKKRATLSATVWAALNAELDDCVSAGIPAETAMTEALVAGWQGFKVDWMVKRLSQEGRMPDRKPAGPDFHSGDTSWANDLGDL